MSIPHRRISRLATLWTKPDSPHAYDAEFESLLNVLPASWVESFTPSGTIDPYTIFNTGVPKREVGTWRSSCYAIQVPNDNTPYFVSRPVTVPTNCFLWGRATFSYRYNQQVGNDSNIGMFFSTTDAGQPDNDNDILKLWFNEADLNSPLQLQVDKTVSGSVTTVMTASDRLSTGIGQYYEYVGIQKLGTTYHFWAFSEHGQMFYLGTTSFAPTVDRIGFVMINANTAAPGNSIVAIDFIRFVESATFLPGYGN